MPGFAESVQDAGSGTSSDTQLRLLTYFKAGHYFKLDLRSGSSFPVATQVSSFSTTDLCGADLPGSNNRVRRFFPDISNALHSGVIFRLPGSDGVCNTADDRFRFVRLDADASNAGLDIPEYVTQINDASGAAVAHVVRNGNAIEQRDADFANPRTLFTVSSGFTGPILRDNDGFSKGLFLYREGDEVRAYNLATGTGPVLVTTLVPNDFPFVYYRSGEAFLLVSRNGASRILRVDDALNVATPVTAATLISSALPMTDFIVYYDGLARSFVSVPKHGGASLTLTACSRSTTTQAFGFVLGDVLYCGPAFNAPPTIEAAAGVKVVAPDGTLVRSFPNAAIVGSGYFNPTTLPYRYQNILLAEGLSASTVGFRGATLNLYGGSSISLLATYGTLPVNALFAAAGFGQFPSVPKLLQAALSTSAGPTDLFVLQDTPPSLVRRTFRLP